MIVAVYENEPYAHMIPMEKVFLDIRKVVAGDGDPSEVQISLP